MRTTFVRAALAAALSLGIVQGAGAQTSAFRTGPTPGAAQSARDGDRYAGDRRAAQTREETKREETKRAAERRAAEQRRDDDRRRSGTDGRYDNGGYDSRTGRGTAGSTTTTARRTTASLDDYLDGISLSTIQRQRIDRVWESQYSREQRLTAVRELLTSAQQRRFDANRARIEGYGSGASSSRRW